MLIYILGTIVELSTSNDNDSCEVGTGVARCLVKFGDGTHAWAPVSSLKLLSAPPADDGRIMCVVCKRREGPASGPATNAIIACDMCGRGYHAKCHSPPVESWINGKFWNSNIMLYKRFYIYHLYKLMLAIFVYVCVIQNSHKKCIIVRHGIQCERHGIRH
jgi:hypothetical protein